MSLAAHTRPRPRPTFPHAPPWPGWHVAATLTAHAVPAARRALDAAARPPRGMAKHRLPCHGTWPARAAQFYLLGVYPTGRTCATRLRDEVPYCRRFYLHGIDVSISTTATGIKNATCPKGGATPLRSGRHRDVNPAHAHGRFSAIGQYQYEPF